MADMKLRGATTGRAVVGNNQMADMAGTRDGIAYSMDWVVSKAIEGKLFTAQLGTLTTPVVFRIGIDLDQPEMVIDVPQGVTMIPVHIAVYLEDMAGTDTEIVAAANPALCGAGTSTAGTILSKRINGNFASGCKFYYTYSADCVDPANYDEFWRDGDPIAQAAGSPKKRFEWTPASAPPPVLVGPASLVIWIDGTTTAPGGYAKVAWVEELSSNL
jgi:hypothetical protein